MNGFLVVHIPNCCSSLIVYGGSCRNCTMSTALHFQWFNLLDILLKFIFLNCSAVPGRWCEPVLLACAWSVHSVSISCNWSCPAPPLGSVDSRCSPVTGLGVSHSTRTSCYVPFRLFSSTFVSQSVMGNIWTVLPLAVSHSTWNSYRLCFTYFAKVRICKSCRSSDVNLADAETGKVCTYH